MARRPASAEPAPAGDAAWADCPLAGGSRPSGVVRMEVRGSPCTRIIRLPPSIQPSLYAPTLAALLIDTLRSLLALAASIRSALPPSIAFTSAGEATALVPKSGLRVSGV